MISGAFRNQWIVFFPLLMIAWGCNVKSHDPLPQQMEMYSTKEDSLEILDSLVEINKIKNPREAWKDAKRAISIAGRDTSSCLYAWANLIAGTACSSDNPDSAFRYFTEALRISNRIACKEIRPGLLYNLGMIYFRASDTRMALVYLDSAIATSKATGDFKTMAKAFNMMGSYYCNIGDTAKALHLFTTSFRIASEKNQYRLMGAAYTNMATLDSRNPDYIAKLRKALGLMLQARGSEQETGMLYNNLGNHMSNPDSALFYFRKSAGIGHISNDHELVILSYNNMAYSYLEKQDIARARQCLDDMAIPVAQKDQNYEMLANLYDTYSDVLMAAGEGMAAAGYLKKASNASKKAAEKQSAGQIRLLMALLDLKSKELTISAHERELQNRRDSEQTMWIIIGLLFFLLLITTLAVFLIQVRNRMKNQVREIENARKIIALETTEKNRVAMQLHDLIGPVRNIITRQIEDLNISDPVIRRNIMVKLDAVSGTLRHLSHRMNSAMMEQLSLGELFCTLQEDFANLTELNVNIEMDPLCHELRGEITGHVFFIALELITNAVKHVPTGSVRLTISVEFDKMYLLYHDDGPGFDPGNTRRSCMGIQNIYDRVKILQGKVNLVSSPGSGTAWTIALPLTNEVLELIKESHS